MTTWHMMAKAQVFRGDYVMARAEVFRGIAGCSCNGRSKVWRPDCQRACEKTIGHCKVEILYRYRGLLRVLIITNAIDDSSIVR